MISQKLFIENRFGEKLGTLKEYKERLSKHQVFHQQKHPTILLIPGLAMDLHEWNGSFDEISKYLVDNGFLTFRFSFAGCGHSEGDFKEMTISRQACQIKDVLSFIIKDSLVDKKRIGVLAQSMGGPSLIQALPLKISSLIFLSSVFDPEKTLKKILIERGAPWKPKRAIEVPRSDESKTSLGPQIWKDFKKLNLKEKLEKHSPTFILVLHGAKDTKVSIKDAKLLYKFSNGKKEMIIYPQGDHGLEEVPLKLRREVLEKIVDWFKKTL